MCNLKNVLAVVLLAVAMPGHAQLVINEIMQSNVECIMDDIKEFPDSWVELYNPTDADINNRLHADFRLESGKGCVVYLFTNKEIVDSLPYVDGKPMVKMPAPDVAFGRKTDGASEWGYQLTPTPGKANTGEICKAKQILGAPVFSVPGRVVNYGQKSVSVELSLPEGAPEGAYITYTTDGSEPTATGKKYTEAFHITKSTAIRAKVFCEG